MAQHLDAADTDAEHAWRDGCPKPVLFEIALQLAILANGDEDRPAALARLGEEWDMLREARLLPDEGAGRLPALPPVAPAAARRTVFEALGLRLRWPFVG